MNQDQDADPDQRELTKTWRKFTFEKICRIKNAINFFLNPLKGMLGLYEKT
jgi:hypothetical protein